MLDPKQPSLKLNCGASRMGSYRYFRRSGNTKENASKIFNRSQKHRISKERAGVLADINIVFPTTEITSLNKFLIYSVATSHCSKSKDWFYNLREGTVTLLVGDKNCISKILEVSDIDFEHYL
ncbi:hypothetical protein CEXT_623161 [Caerostris extrusa]|uniref:LAGLIDADG homing endonuclease n=1 Tax=Caerostris extrusa TaxID=172846 RepID=A0AAV4WMT1_CAEEX|nr:hypothetical protein CEXT_623161 [Caerostris extrusa]